MYIYLGEGLRSLWRLRRNALLTFLILAFGITALIGILTAVDALRKSLIETFGGVGGRNFRIYVGESISLRIGRKKTSTSTKKKKDRVLPFSLDQVKAFQAAYSKENILATTLLLETTTARYQSRKTNPSINVLGASLSVLEAEELTLAQGRWFTQADERLALRVIVIGAGVARTLFPHSSPLSKIIQVGNHYYEVIGVLESKGTLFFSQLDNVCYIPLSTALSYTRSLPNYTLIVKVPSPEKLSQAIQNATFLMRQVRGLLPREENDFIIFNSTEIADTLLSALGQIKIAALALGIITLIGASVSLANMMLIQVKERTREIGIRKAIGASRQSILVQFLTEATGIALAGGAMGIIVGILLGNAVGIFLNTPFFIPWDWIGLGIGLCSLSGTVAGLYPALKAAQLDPVEALRYE
ncbi:MAG: ABC transporter permease [Bacteroidia bacterium]